MEEWIGQWWHRIVTKAAEPERAEVQVTLDEMRRSIALLYRAGGGDAAVRVAPVADSRHGGPRGWLQRLAGSDIRLPMPVLDWETLALPAQVAVFDERELNRELYLWLAALAAVFEPTGDWVADNRAATARALQRFAGLRGRQWRDQLHQALAGAPLQITFEVIYGHAFKPKPRLDMRAETVLSLAQMRESLNQRKSYPTPSPD